MYYEYDQKWCKSWAFEARTSYPCSIFYTPQLVHFPYISCLYRLDDVIMSTLEAYNLRTVYFEIMVCQWKLLNFSRSFQWCAQIRRILKLYLSTFSLHQMTFGPTLIPKIWLLDTCYQIFLFIPLKYFAYPNRNRKDQFADTFSQIGTAMRRTKNDAKHIGNKA